jgi:CBS domain-containing protein
MRRRKIGALPVLDGDELVGIVTVADLLDLIIRGPGAPRSRKPRGSTRSVPKRISRRVR